MPFSARAHALQGRSLLVTAAITDILGWRPGIRSSSPSRRARLLFNSAVRIALLPSAYHPSVGGVEELTRRLGLELVAQGHEVQIWTSRSPGDGWLARESLDGMEVRRFTFPAPRLDFRALVEWSAAAVRQVAALRSAANDYRPDVLHVQCFSTNGAYATLLSRLLGVPLVVSLQGETVMDDNDIFEHSTFLKTALRLGLRQARAVTACSAFTLADASSRFGLVAGKSSIIFNGVDIDEAPLEPVDVPFPRFVLAMGRVVPKKGFDLLIRAWATIEQDHPEVGLVVGGRGPSLDDLKRLTDELGVGSRVSFPGVLSRGRVAWAMRRSTVFVMPSRLEPFGIVALEGWRGGAAVVVSSRGGAAEFVTDGENGLVVDPLDVAALADSLDVLLRDEALRLRLAEAGQERVREFSWSRIAEQYLKVYRRVVAT